MPPKPAECPICGRPAAEGRPNPFCSVRCAEVDLGRWFTGAYAIPVKPEEEDDDSQPPPLDPGPGIR